MGRARQWLPVPVGVVAVALGLGSVAFVALAGEDGSTRQPIAGTVGAVPGTVPTEETPEPTPTVIETPTPEPTPDVATTPMEAVERAVVESGREFFGNCALLMDVITPGAVCAWEHGTSGEQLAFGVSPVEQAWFATELYFVVREGEGWVVDHVEPGPCRNQVPCPPPPGATVEIVTDEADSCANVRREPGINGEKVDCLANGTLALVSDWPVEMDARIWVPLADMGWVSASYLRCVGNCELPEDFFSCGVTS